MNKLRGEVEIELTGEKWTLRPTFEALSNIEGTINKSIPEIVRDQRSGSIRVTAIATIIWEGIVAANDGEAPMTRSGKIRKMRYEDVGDMIVKDGLANILSQEGLLLFMLYGLAGDQKMEEGRKAAEQEEKLPTPRTE